METGIAFAVRELFSGQAELTLLEGVLIWQSLVGGFLIIQAMLHKKFVMKWLRRLLGFKGQDLSIH